MPVTLPLPLRRLSNINSKLKLFSQLQCESLKIRLLNKSFRVIIIDDSQTEALVLQLRINQLIPELEVEKVSTEILMWIESLNFEDKDESIVVFLDLNLRLNKDFDGIDVERLLRLARPNSTIIALTSSSPLNDNAVIYNKFDNFLFKPVSTSELKCILNYEETNGSGHCSEEFG